MRTVARRAAWWVLPLLVWTTVARAAPDPREMQAREEIEGYSGEREELKKTQANNKQGAGGADAKVAFASAPPAGAAAPPERAPAPAQVVIVERGVAVKPEPAPALDLSARPAPAA